MYRGKHVKQHKSKKLFLTVFALFLLLFLSTGGTIAYLVDKTEQINNTFIPAEVSCEVVETFSDDYVTKRNVHIHNTGSTDAYIRAAVIVNWVNEEGVYGKQPVAGIDYTITYLLNPAGWIKYPDGYYYYANSVAPGGATTYLIDTCTPVAGRAPEGCRLSVEILAAAIQSEPRTVAKDVWGVTMNAAGNILEKGSRAGV